MSILIIDDEELIRVQATKVLSRAGFATRTAESAQAGLDWVASGNKVDVALVDVCMSGISGIELVRRLRRIQPNLACILSSGFSVEEIALPEELRPGTFYLRKPYQPTQLLALVQSLMTSLRVGL